MVERGESPQRRDEHKHQPPRGGVVYAYLTTVTKETGVEAAFPVQHCTCTQTTGPVPATFWFSCLKQITRL